MVSPSEFSYRIPFGLSELFELQLVDLSSFVVDLASLSLTPL